jgi:TetR/AcrR family fatty acid metabolism transcriptional regulator
MELESRRETRKLAFRKKILKSAEKLFLEKKYSSIKIDDIAARAGVTKRTLYTYFPSKLALYTSMFDDYLKKLSLEISEAAKIPAPTEQLILNMFEVAYKFTRKNERFMRLYWMLDSDEFEGVIPAELLRYVQEHSDNMFNTLVTVFSKARKDGQIADVDPLLLAHLISALNKGIIIHVSKERRFSVAEINPDDLSDLARVILKQGLFRSPAGHTQRVTVAQDRK